MSSRIAGKSLRPFVDRNFGFSLYGMKTFPELLPLISMCTAGLAGGVWFMFYSLWQKPDVRVNPYETVPRSERVKAGDSQKLWDINQKYPSIPELDALRKEIGDFTYK